MADDLLINVAGVSRSFGDVQALTNLTIEVPKGAISVLLGPNGAGKTTAIRMITGALTPDTGTVSVFGIDPGGREGEQVRRQCGVVSAKPSLYDRLSGWDNLRYAAELYGLGTDADNRIREAAEQFGIDAALNHEVGGYSTGMKTRLALARAVLHKPELLLLDEPTSGLDPESANAVLELIRDMTKDGQTVLMCTHLLLEAEGLADDVVMMEHGTSLIWGRPDELSKKYWPNSSVTIKVSDAAAFNSLSSLDGVIGFEPLAKEPTAAKVEIDSLDRVPQLVSSLVASGAQVKSVEPFKPTLESLYFAVRAERSAPVNGATPPPPPIRGALPPSSEQLQGSAR